MANSPYTSPTIKGALKTAFQFKIYPQYGNKVLLSIVIRTLNEGTHLEELLASIERQVLPQEMNLEVVIVDSGSTDATLEIASNMQCRITHIHKNDFSFGRSLNQGCAFSNGEYLVFVSGHCIPQNEQWLSALIAPLVDKRASYSYGRQLGRGPTKFSERRVFMKYFPDVSRIPQEGYFVNNANAALNRETWASNAFDEELTGLEDMHLGKRLHEQGKKIAYVAEAGVFHIHDESWQQVRNRYEREGMALAEIMPEAAMSMYDLVICTARSISKDCYAAARGGVLLSNLTSIFAFRTLQYWGSFRGTRLARLIAKSKRRSYFYPDQHLEPTNTRIINAGHRASTNEEP